MRAAVVILASYCKSFVPSHRCRTLDVQCSRYCEPRAGEGDHGCEAVHVLAGGELHVVGVL